MKPGCPGAAPGLCRHGRQRAGARGCCQSCSTHFRCNSAVTCITQAFHTFDSTLSQELRQGPHSLADWQPGAAAGAGGAAEEGAQRSGASVACRASVQVSRLLSALACQLRQPPICSTRAERHRRLPQPVAWHSGQQPEELSPAHAGTPAARRCAPAMQDQDTVRQRFYGVGKAPRKKVHTLRD